MKSKMKNEIYELRDKLATTDPDTLKTTIPRVLNHMRCGEDVSSLFSQMLMCVQTADISLKRQIYLYLVTYSRQEPEQSIMAVNAFIKDSEDSNPFVRALAVRTMCKIKLETVAEYMIIPLKKSMGDQEPYVRKTAALAVAKLYEVVPESIENAGMLEMLLDMINDENPLVIANATTALLEINERRKEKILKLDKDNISPILAATTQASECVSVLLLDSLANYVPESQDEASFLIDRMIPFLNLSNPAMVIGAFRIIYQNMERAKRDTNELFKQIIPPFLTLISREQSEIQYVVLRTLSLFVQKYPKVLSKDVRIFFCKYNEPSYVKMEKLNIILTIATPINVQLILSEFEEYCNSVDVNFVRKCVDGIGQIAIKIPSAARGCVDLLMKMVERKAEYAVEQSIIVVANILRAFPGSFESIISKVCSSIDTIKEPKSKAALIWILGEYSSLIENVDVLIDPFLDTFHDEASEVQIQILTTMVKLYIGNPDKTRDQIQFILNEATKLTVLPDVRNRALIYWRLLSFDTNVAKQTIMFQKDTISIKESKFDDHVLEELIQNMGRVSGVLFIVPSDFIQRQLNLSTEEEDILECYNNWERVFSDDSIDIFLDWKKYTICIRAINKLSNPISDFAIALNNNIYGIALKELPSFPQQLEFGESFEIEIPLMISESHKNNNEAIQIALKTNIGTKMFQTNVNISYFIVKDDRDISLDQFKQLWESTKDEYQFQILNETIADAPTLKKRGLTIVQDQSYSTSVTFTLFSSYIYLVALRQNGNDIQVLVRGNSLFFNAIQNSLKSLFTKN